MKFNVLLLTLFIGISASFDAIAKDKGAKKPHKNCKEICKPTRIKKPGCYILDKDIRGVIEIAADCVTLDLNGHTIKGDSVNPSIVAHGVNKLCIENGSLDKCGLSVKNGTDVKLQKLKFTNCSTIAATLELVERFSIDRCKFTKNHLSSPMKVIKIICSATKVKANKLPAGNLYTGFLRGY